MTMPFHFKDDVEKINVSLLSDDIVFALGNYIRTNKISKETIERGINFCDALIKGKAVKKDSMKIQEMYAYEKYKIIEKNKELIEEEGFDINALSEKAAEIKVHLENFTNDKKVKEEVIAVIQKFFVTISLPFWHENLTTFYKRKMSRGLRINA